MSFSRAHSSMLIRYIGISFITGAIAHGFFSWSRAIATGIAGIILFVIGSLLEQDSTKSESWKTILTGAMLAIGIGAVTGGLQHFPDSPERSLWIIPVGYIVSLVFFTAIHGYKIEKKIYGYSLISTVFMLIFSLGIYGLLETTGIAPHTHEDEITSTTEVHAEKLSGPKTEATTPEEHADDHHD